MSEALCVGRWELFDSTDPNDHREAAALCRECPMLLTCRKLLEEASLSPFARYGGPQGTWAGQLLRATTGKVAETVVCPTCLRPFAPRNASYRYCSRPCAITGRQRSAERHQRRRNKASACVDCGTTTGGTRCVRCQAVRASKIAHGWRVA